MHAFKALRLVNKNKNKKNFREKLNGYVERNFDNVKDVLCVVTDMEDMTEN